MADTLAPYDLGADLNTVLQNAGINSAIIQTIDNFIANNAIGGLTGPTGLGPPVLGPLAPTMQMLGPLTPTMQVQSAATGLAPAGLTSTSDSGPTIEVELVSGSTPATINTDVTPSPQLIIDLDTGLTVKGSSSVIVASGNNNGLINLQDSGNDFVATGDGNDTVFAGAGADTIVGGAGNDLFAAGTGTNQLISAGSGNDVLIGGSGANDTLQAGTGSDLLLGGAGAGQLLDATLGAADTIFAGSGNDTLLGGAGNDVFVVGRFGSDTIDGGGGDNTIYFDHANDSNVAISTPDANGITTITFSDTNQTIKVSNVTAIHFSDGTTHSI
jgi:Ca2+-binding RTX toxin-like protein